MLCSKIFLWLFKFGTFLCTARKKHSDFRNYRPITLLTLLILLSTVDKVFESMMSIQVNNHFDSKLDPCISAYRKKHSCETTLLRLTEDWKLAVDSEQSIEILSTDMSKAFDSLHPSLMINKLKAYGFSEESLSLMRSYLFQSTKQSQTKWSHQQLEGCC